MDTDYFFADDNERLLKLKEFQLTPKTFDRPKDVYYRDNNGTFTKCEVIGMELHPTLNILIIKVNDKVKKICLDYLKEMQPTAKEVK